MGQRADTWRRSRRQPLAEGPRARQRLPPDRDHVARHPPAHTACCGAWATLARAICGSPCGASAPAVVALERPPLAAPVVVAATSYHAHGGRGPGARHAAAAEQHGRGAGARAWFLSKAGWAGARAAGRAAGSLSRGARAYMCMACWVQHGGEDLGRPGPRARALPALLPPGQPPAARRAFTARRRVGRSRSRSSRHLMRF